MFVYRNRGDTRRRFSSGLPQSYQSRRFGNVRSNVSPSALMKEGDGEGDEAWIVFDIQLVAGDQPNVC